MKNAMVQKFQNKNRVFKFSPDNRYLRVYINGRLNGFIWNTDKVIRVDGIEVVSSDFFK